MVSSNDIVTGEVDGATVLLVDDLIATFGTIDRAASALLKAGARRVLAFAAHGLFVGPAADVLEHTAVERVFITDTVPPFRIAARAACNCVEVLPAAGPDPEQTLTAGEGAALRRHRLQTALASLKPRERAVLERRYLADEPASLADLGREHGLSRERMRQIEARALDKLRGALAQDAREVIDVDDAPQAQAA